MCVFGQQKKAVMSQLTLLSSSFDFELNGIVVCCASNNVPSSLLFSRRCSFRALALPDFVRKNKKGCSNLYSLARFFKLSCLYLAIFCFRQILIVVNGQILNIWSHWICFYTEGYDDPWGLCPNLFLHGHGCIYALSAIGLGGPGFYCLWYQCYQMARLFFNIWPLIDVKICPIAEDIWQAYHRKLTSLNPGKILLKTKLCGGSWIAKQSMSLGD